ncbi:hypothetical protein M422DRAFT_269826 [Sphaerobolus stellatus SS14]|uniref:Uncharacterized protein n=1 Tax=Sphaerobolus stellatus (strain SS14) TaxID=990650 RepID=A0A0C9UUK0_SPHS4|nr:hypothetical protein M422DRAFT_269826 [Sphaerobolus stellatus SS14]
MDTVERGGGSTRLPIKRQLSRATASVHRPFASVLSFEELGIDVEKVIADSHVQTSALVNEARTIAKSTRDIVFQSYKNHIVYVGVLLEALIDYAGKDAFPGRGDITGER